ncbi:MAG TPA: hypothetical protein VFS12_01250, partial [Terriglobia bacterium]|nr:hypothetical protein [Terriglobia bacterium]
VGLLFETWKCDNRLDSGGNRELQLIRLFIPVRDIPETFREEHLKSLVEGSRSDGLRQTDPNRGTPGSGLGQLANPIVSFQYRAFVFSPTGPTGRSGTAREVISVHGSVRVAEWCAQRE